MGKKLKKYFSVLLVAAMLVTSCPINVFAEEEVLQTESVTEEKEDLTLASSSNAKKEETQEEEKASESIKESVKESAKHTTDSDAEYIAESAAEETKKATDSDVEYITESATSSDAEYDETNYPAFNLTSENIDGIKVTVTAEEGVFPAGSKLAVKKVSKSNEDKKDIEAAVDNAKLFEDNDDDREDTTAETYTLDIKVLDKDGNEVEPKDDASVSVKFELVENAQQLKDAKVYHLEETDESKLAKLDELFKKAEETAKAAKSVEEAEDDFDYSLLDGEVIDNVTKKQGKVYDSAAALIKAQEESENANEAEEKEFKESAFVATELETEIKTDEESNVVETTTDGFSYYVVEFYFGTYEYVLEGDSEIELQKILDTLNIPVVASELRAEDITVSNSELFVPYHKAVDDGFVWFVKALQAFSSEEWMKVSADGETWVIKVTDDAEYEATMDGKNLRH